MKKLFLAVLVSFGFFNAGASFACTCAIIESYGNLPNLQNYKSIMAGRVVDKKIGSDRDTLTIKINQVWRGNPVKTVLLSIPKGNDRYSRCCPEPLIQYSFAKSLEKGNDYIFLGDYPQYLGSVIPLNQGQSIFAELGAIAVPESSNKSNIGVNGIPLTCQLQNLSSSLYNSEDRESELFWLSSRYAIEGDRTNALQIANRIEDAGLKANIFLSLEAKTQEVSRFDRALQAMDNQASNQDVFILTTIRELVNTNHFDRAIQVSNKIKDSSYKREALEFLALKLVEANELDRAQQLLIDIPDYPHYYGELKSSKGYVALGVVEKLLQSDNYDRALKIDNRFFRIRALLAIGRKYALNKNFPKALEIVNIIDFVPSRHSGFVFYHTPDSLQYEARSKIEFLFQIASLAAKSGDRDTALQIAERENNRELSSNILMAIAIQYLKDGNTKLGDEFLRQSIEGSESFYRFRLAQQAIQSGFAERILLLNEYFSDKKIAPDRSQREQVFSFLAASLIEKEKFVDAEKLLKTSLSEAESNPLKWTMVWKLVEKGRYDEALKIARGLPDFWQNQRLHTIFNIAKKLSELGNRDKSLQLIQDEIQQPNPQYEFLSIHSQELGFDDLALELAQKIPLSFSFRAGTFQELALKYVEKGDDRRAFEMLKLMDKAITDRPDQNKDLEIEARDRRNSVLQKLVKRAISDRKYDLALETTDKMTEKFETEYFGNGSSNAQLPNMQKTLLLSDIAIQFAKSGEFEKSIQAAAKIRDIQMRDRTWEAIVLEQSSRGNYQEGLAIANRILDRVTRNKLSNLLTCASQS